MSSYNEVNGHKLGIRIQPNPRSSYRWQAFLGGGSPCRGIVPAAQIPSTVRSQWRRYNPSCKHVFPSFACITFTLWWWWFHDQLSLLFFIIISVYRLISHSLSLLTFVCHYYTHFFSLYFLDHCSTCFIITSVLSLITQDLVLNTPRRSPRRPPARRVSIGRCSQSFPPHLPPTWRTARALGANAWNPGDQLESVAYVSVCKKKTWIKGYKQGAVPLIIGGQRRGQWWEL